MSISERLYLASSTVTNNKKYMETFKAEQKEKISANIFVDPTGNADSLDICTRIKRETGESTF
jgi:uncharacterized protein YnzC (UPF0291/DUF896 family)